MYTNPTHTPGAPRSKFGRLFVTAVVLLVLAAYAFGGLETVLKAATGLSILGMSNPDFEQGKRLSAIADWRGAVSAFSKAIAREPDNFAIYNARADAELRLGDQAAGFGDLKLSLAIKPNAEAYLIRSYYLYAAKTEDRGEADTARALELEPDNFAALTRHLFVYQKMGPAYDAEEIANYTHAIKLFPAVRKRLSKAEVDDGIYNLYAGRAGRLLSQKRYGEAIADYNQIFEQGSHDAFMLILKVREFKALLAQLPPDSAEAKGFQQLIQHIEATGAVVR